MLKQEYCGFMRILLLKIPDCVPNIICERGWRTAYKADRKSRGADFHYALPDKSVPIRRSVTRRMVVGVSLCQHREKCLYGPRFLGVPLCLPGVPRNSPWGPEAPSACASHPVCQPGPTHFGTLADPSKLFF